MRLLFDHNLSHKLVKRLADLFPDSTQTKLLGLETATDDAIWNHARREGLAVVTLDADFADMSLLQGHPPKVIWLRCGNATVTEVEHLLRSNHARIDEFGEDAQTSCLEVWP